MTLATLSGLKTLRLYLNNDVEHLPPLGKLLMVESLEIWFANRVKKVGVEFLGIEEESNNNHKIDDEKGSTSSSSSSSLVLFPNLKSLQFYNMNEWEEWDGIGGTMREEEAQESGVTITIMPRLQNLQFWKCPMLKSLPDLLPTTPLKTLKIFESPILSECCKTKIGDQWPKISHIPNIQIDYKMCEEMVKLNLSSITSAASHIHSVKATSFTLSSSYLSFFLSFSTKNKQYS